MSGKKPKKLMQIIIPLSTPIKWGEDNVVDEIVLRRPTGKELQLLPAEPALKDLIVMAQRCSTHTKRIFDDLDIDDTIEVAEAMADFLDSGQRTGKKRIYS